MSADRVKIRVVYGCYYRGARYEPGVYELEREIAEGLLRTLHAVRETAPKASAKLKKEATNGS